MAGRKAETMVKLARERALREKRERKQAKKDARAAARLAGETLDGAAADDGPESDDAAEPDSA